MRGYAASLPLSHSEHFSGPFGLLPWSLIYRTRAIITRGLYLFYLIFHCGLYSREVYIAERFVLQGNFFFKSSTTKPSNYKMHKLFNIMLQMLQWYSS